MTKFKIGDRVKDVSDSAPSHPYGTIEAINILGQVSVEWDYDLSMGYESHISFHDASDFILVENETTELEPWNLMQVSIHNKEKFKETLLNILNEGRKLTPMEVVKVEDFLGIV